ncbi:transcription factor bHLH71-like [Rutidosis leptorrhynchoides]|uniref:transcription factor bHLH71-like n=1 Tax=Rutidosis leptorrhynchoides TaxID=125765 RepID=UPI003A99713F
MDVEEIHPVASELPNFIIRQTTVFHHQFNSSPSMENPKKKKKTTREKGNKKQVETQRMSHIVVERNRRKLMNQHLAVLRSLLPQSHIQRGDQASIVDGAIEFVKELEHLLHSLEAQKFLLSTQSQQNPIIILDQNNTISTNLNKECEIPQLPLYFHKLFPSPWSSQVPNKNSSISKATMADIEVNLVQTHANLRILSRKRVTQLSKMIVYLQICNLSILHLNINTLDPLVLYSISLKVEEGCWLKSADDIAGAVHHILNLIEEEATLCLNGSD